jgi:ABC-type oligopeptide transport system substrate-binding subunit
MVRAMVAVVIGAGLLMPLVGCEVGNVRTGVVVVNSGEPQNPLIPTNTNEVNGARIVDRLFAGLMSYDVKGTPALEVAQSIETTDNVNYRITLKPGWTFSDGSEAAPSLPQSFELANAAQRILLGDMPAVPLWYTVAVGGRSPAVSDLPIRWNGLPDYEHIVKA